MILPADLPQRKASQGRLVDLSELNLALIESSALAGFFPQGAQSLSRPQLNRQPSLSSTNTSNPYRDAS